MSSEIEVGLRFGVYSPRREIQERAPGMIAELKARNVDAVLLVPV